MDDVNVQRQTGCAFRNFFLNLVKTEPFREDITISSICNKMYQIMFLKPDTVGIILRGGYRMGDHETFEALQCLAYIGRTRKNVTQTCNGQEVHLAGLHNFKVDGCCSETNEVFEYLGCFGMGVLVCPIDTSPWVNHKKNCWDGMRKNGSAGKDKGAGYNVLSNWGCEFRKLLHDNPGLENELCSKFYMKNPPINILDGLYGCRTEATKTWYKTKLG